MFLSRMTIGLAAAASLTVGLAFADSDDQGPYAREIAARESQMKLMAFNIGLLGGMAKGDIDYNGEAASSAAANLAALAALDMHRAWPKGSDNSANDNTRALPAIWEEGSKVGESLMNLKTTTAALADAAGTDLDALRGAIGPVGKTCGGCHKMYRAEDDDD